MVSTGSACFSLIFCDLILFIGQEFGIDIVSDDNKTIIHHKVAAKVFLVLSHEDAIAAGRLVVDFESVS